MIEAMLVVLSRAVDGRDEEMNDWYTNIHIRDALRYRGSTAVQRFSAAPAQPGPLPADWPYRYLALYEAYDAMLFTQAHRDAADTVWMEISEAFDVSSFNEFYYYPLAWRSNSVEETHRGGVVLEQFNALPGSDEQLRSWYCDEQLPAAVKRPGVHAGAFLAFRPYAQQLPHDPPHRHVAIYWLQDDAAASAAWNDPGLASAGLIDPASLTVTCWQPLTRRVTEDEVHHPTAAGLAAEEEARRKLKRPARLGGRAVLGLE